jgi:glycosyltransferase involved in cell wall biosynthesis
MRILQANKFLFPRGGSESQLFGLADALTWRGHDVGYLGMADPRNITPANRTWTVPTTDYRTPGSWLQRLAAFGRMVYSRAAARAIDRLRQEFAVELVHAHNVYHQLSPSVLRAAKRAGLPCVLTAHDFKLVCPAYTLHDGNAPCFACRGHRYGNVLGHACSQRGVAGDLALATEAYVQRLLRVYERHVDLIIAPSRYLRDRLLEGGFAPRQILVLPNAVPVDRFEADPTPGDYMLYAGRLCAEKGLRDLLAAAARVPDVPIWLAGDGPLRAELRSRSAGLPQVRLLGFQDSASLRGLMRRCRAVVLPSSTPENCPVSVLEAFASAKPVIATRSGGLPELFDGSACGTTIAAGDIDGLAAAIREFWNDRELCWHRGVEARRHVETRYDLADYVGQIESIYESLRAGGAGHCGTVRARPHHAPEPVDELDHRSSPFHRSHPREVVETVAADHAVEEACP